MVDHASDGIEGVILDRLQPHEDERGRLVEIHRLSRSNHDFPQAVVSRSRKNVLRGLHFHRHQADLWYVLSGRAQVALADLRPGQGRPITLTLELDAATPATLYIPAGVAHGYLALEDMEMLYMFTREFDGRDEHGLAWNDDALGIAWSLDDPILSERDRSNPRLSWDAIPPLG
ncbi:MAG: dTDP-4-dehydrorhamnose 3,5-epimerase family protein [Actinomycetota bacterium]